MKDMVGLVQEDLDDRRDVGLERYGQLLDINDGRDWLTEAYEEALDLVVYLRAGLAHRQAAEVAITEAFAKQTKPVDEDDPWHAIEELSKDVAALELKVAGLKPLPAWPVQYPSIINPPFTPTYNQPYTFTCGSAVIETAP